MYDFVIAARPKQAAILTALAAERQPRESSLMTTPVGREDSVLLLKENFGQEETSNRRSGEPVWPNPGLLHTASIPDAARGYPS
jgi:hypothetical protein